MWLLGISRAVPGKTRCYCCNPSSDWPIAMTFAFSLQQFCHIVKIFSRFGCRGVVEANYIQSSFIWKKLLHELNNKFWPLHEGMQRICYEGMSFYDILGEGSVLFTNS